MTPECFDRLVAEGYDYIPVSLEMMADFDTPLSVYCKVAAEPYSYLLESAQGGKTWGRYSFIGLGARRVLKVYGNTIHLYSDRKLSEQLAVANPMDYIESLQRQYRVPSLPDSPRFTGGWVGYFGYDAVRYTEPLLQATTPKDTLGNPDILLMESKEVIVFDNFSNKLTLVRMTASAKEAYSDSMDILNALKDRLQTGAIQAFRQSGFAQTSETVFEYDRDEFMQGVEKIVDYTLAGDVM